MIPFFKQTLLFLPFFFFFTQVTAQTKFHDGDTLAYNTALNGTYIYNNPALDAPTLALIDYGEGLRIVQTNVQHLSIFHKGIQSHWLKVRIKDTAGYILDTDLSSIDIKNRTLLRNNEYKWYFREQHGLDTSMYYKANCSTFERDETGDCSMQYLKTKDSIEVLTHRKNGQEIYQMTLPNFSLESFFLAARCVHPQIAWADLRDASGTRYVKTPANKNIPEIGYTLIYQRDSTTQYITHLAILPYPESNKEGLFELRVKYLRPNVLKILLKTEPIERIAEPVQSKKKKS